ncbi:membrane protein [Nocardiopsis terrae]|uniref:DUF2752 domain-containing protein n=1 Tax=Nocardiopsis terrae TaxID=372655 RepID=A0ABR9HJC5_9ACTN|nr:DUF2752 domain-containing protein [Nocardiopsis terrae]MBE1459109.1 hypothetical protein [Nocardiopsis terrae]GHC88172.1 membrane protein [Nocardiopsis terrae]
MQHDKTPTPAEAGTPAAPTLADRIGAVGARMHPVTWPLSLGALGLAAAVLLHLVDPNEPGNYPTCPWLLLTGTFCPGCGTMRAVALLTRLDVPGALGMNPLLLLLLPYLAYSYLAWLIGTLRPRTRPGNPTPTWFLWAVLGAFVVFWIARNLPWFAFLAPGTPLLPQW